MDNLKRLRTKNSDCVAMIQTPLPCSIKAAIADESHETGKTQGLIAAEALGHRYGLTPLGEGKTRDFEMAEYRTRSTGKPTEALFEMIGEQMHQVFRNACQSEDCDSIPETADAAARWLSVQMTDRRRDLTGEIYELLKFAIEMAQLQVTEDTPKI